MRRASLARMVATAAIVTLGANCGGISTPAPAGGGGGGGEGAPTVVVLTLRPLGSGPMSGISDEVFDVLRDEAAWRAFWSTHAPAAAVPAVDFASEMVAAIVLQRNTGGYAVRIDGARVTAGQLTISYTETRPGPDDVVIQVLTQPWALAALPARQETVGFETR